MKRKFLSLLLTAAVLLTVTPIIAWAEESESVVYTQDFEAANVGDSVKRFTTSGEQDIPGLYLQGAYEGGSGHYGRFRNATADGNRVGFKFSESGITEGTLHVSFKFRAGDASGTTNESGTVLIGNEDNNTSEWLTLLHIRTGGAVNVANVDNTSFQICDKNGTQLTLDADKWYTYDAKLNLDTRSMDVTVTGNGVAGSVSLSELDRQTGSGDPFKKWPKVTKIKEIATIYRPIDMDDIVISRPALKAEGLTYLTSAGEKRTEASFETDRGVLHFTQPAAEVGSGAVTVNGENCTGGELSEDGMSYTFNLPSPLTPAWYTVVAKPALITPKYTDIPIGGEAKFQFIIQVQPSNATIYTQDFEDENVGDSVKNFTDAQVDPKSSFERKEESNGSSQNHYGSFINAAGSGGAANNSKIGFRFSEQGISDGTIHVSFKFRKSATNTPSMVLIGNENKSNNNEWFTLLYISGTKVISGLNQDNYATFMAKNGSDALVLEANKWYTYEANLYLDTQGIYVTITDENGEKYTVDFTKANALASNNTQYNRWPVVGFKVKEIASVLRPIDIDDIVISRSPMIYEQHFENDNVTDYIGSFTSNNGTQYGAGGTFAQTAYDDGSGYYGSFQNDDAIQEYARIGFAFRENGAANSGIEDGAINVRFKFRPSGMSSEKPGMVAIGNDDAKYHWLTLLYVGKDGKVNAAIANSTNGDLHISDESGEQLTLSADKWYTYEAKLNLDTRSMDITVTGDDVNGTLSLRNMPQQQQTEDGSGQFVQWPLQTCMKEIAAVQRPIDIDDIEIYRVSEPTISADDNNNVNASGFALGEDNILIVAQYDENGCMVQVDTVKQETAKLKEGAPTFLSVDRPWAEGAVKAGAFLWNELGTLVPLGKAAVTVKP